MLGSTAFFLTLLASLVSSATDFCNVNNYPNAKNLCSTVGNDCPAGTKHVTCLVKDQVADKCKNYKPYILNTTSPQRELIIYKINQLRNAVAGGTIVGSGDLFLPKAVRAGYTLWQCHLAYLAMWQAKQCNFEGDQCHITSDYKNSGQLIYNDIRAIGTLDPNVTIDRAFNVWSAGSINTTYADIANFTSHDGIDSFALLANDHNDGVGCALIYFETNDTHACHTLICNFVVNNTEGCPVYTKGKVSRCNCYGYSRSHPNLCDIKEAYNETCTDADFCTSQAALLCPGSTHIACATPVATPATLVPITLILQNKILSLINNYRNETAKGNTVGEDDTNLPKAKAMAEAAWSTDLADLAKLHAVECSNNKDHCRSSYSFRNPGQSIHIASGLSDPSNTAAIIENSITSWYNQRVNIDSATISSYVSSSDYEDFAIMVHERNLRVGCAIALSGIDKACFVCNYATTPEDGCAVYNTGTIPASGCKFLSPTSNKTLCSTDNYKSEKAPYTYALNTCV